MAEEQDAPAWAQRLSAFIHRRFRVVLLIGLVFAVLSTLAATQLRIDQELRRLLPSTFPSVVRLDRLQERAGQQSDLYVTIRSPSREANVAFGDAVVDALQGRDDLRYVVFRRDLKYFDDHALLYASLADLLDLRRRVIAKVREEVRKEAFGDFSTDEEKAAQAGGKDDAEALGFDPDEMRDRYGVSEASQEYMEADEGRVMVVKMRPVRAATDLEFAEALTGDVLRIVDELAPHGFHHEMAIELNGSYVQHQKRLKSVQDEVRGGSVAALLGLLVTLGLYFRSPRAVALVMIPLLVSVVGALAFGWLAFGVLNIVSAFIFAVLLGLGIDFGIHVLARLRQERGRGLSSQDALALCLATSGKTTAAGAVSTALAFAALSIADFQGFAQFGQVAAVGVVFSLLGSVFLMPALSIAFDRVRPWKPPAPREDSGGLGGWGLSL
ncbi:MAG: MMPL family transporter, partial [Nannocystaceae bacterium]|nr:MMPL family transporter [Nannocystaceae bacterium]